MKPMPKYTIYRYTVYLNRLNTNIMYIVMYTIDITYYDGYPVQTKILQNFNKNKLDVVFFIVVHPIFIIIGSPRSNYLLP